MSTINDKGDGIPANAQILCSGWFDKGGAPKFSQTDGMDVYTWTQGVGAADEGLSGGGGGR